MLTHGFRDRKHVDWIQSFYQIFKSLVRYVKEHHAAGLIWNKDGRDAREVMKDVHLGQSSTNAPVPQGSAGAGGSGAAPPPPPPPPPPPLPTLDSTAPGAQSKAQDGGDMDAVFAQLNQGEAVTATLRKVDKSEMTHRNPALRAGSIVPQRTSSQTSLSSVSRGKSPAPPGKKPKPESMRAKRPPRKELDGNKWIIVGPSRRQAARCPFMPLTPSVSCCNRRTTNPSRKRSSSARRSTR